MTYSKFQLWALLGLNAVAPFSFEIIFPFVNQFMLEIGVVDDPKEVGYYSGVVESIYALSQLVMVIPLTWVADKYGRKPTIIWPMVVIAISMVLFGTSKTYAQMIGARILGGAIAGSNTSIRVMASEISSKGLESHIFTLLSVSYRTGQILGQPVGGTLAHPERQWSKLFGTPFWTEYPYALPCFFASVYALAFGLLGQIVLKETLPSKRATTHQKDHATISVAEAQENTPLLVDSPTRPSSPAAPPQTWTYRSLLTWPLISLLTSQVLMVLITEIFFAVYPLFAFTSIENGGLGLTEAQIGFHMAVRSILFLAPTIPFSWLERKFGKVPIYQFSIFVCMPTIALFPVLNWIARAGGKDGILWYATLFALWTTWGVTSWAWIAVFLISSNFSPSAEALASVQGLVSMSVVGPQAFAPAIGTATFSFAIKHPHVLRGNLFWIAIFALSALALLQSLTLRESDRDWRENVVEQEQEEETTT